MSTPRRVLTTSFYDADAHSRLTTAFPGPLCFHFLQTREFVLAQRATGEGTGSGSYNTGSQSGNGKSQKESRAESSNMRSTAESAVMDVTLAAADLKLQSRRDSTGVMAGRSFRMSSLPATRGVAVEGGDTDVKTDVKTFRHTDDDESKPVQAP